MKFNIVLSPVANLSMGWDPLSVSKYGNVLTINGETFDLSVIPLGSTLPNANGATGCEYFTGDIERDDNGDFHITLLLPHGDKAPEEARFPAPIVVDEDGTVSLPDVGDVIEDAIGEEND